MGENVRVLVIDDDEVMRGVLELVLGETYDVRLVESGEAAVEVLVAAPASSLPHAVLTDLQMPGLSGAALVTRLRDLLPVATRVIAMSGSQPAVAELVACDGFLLKPFAAEDFAAALAGGDAAEATETDGTVDIALNHDIYAKLQASMPAEQVAQLYTLCLDDAEARVGRMREASSADNAALFVREAHAIKGGCGMLGATELHALAGKMETGALACTPLLDEFTVAAGRLRRMLEAHRP